MKIDAPRAWAVVWGNGKLDMAASPVKDCERDKPVRIVRESDWRKIMAVVKAVDRYNGFGGPATHNAIDALRKHLEKRK